MIWAQQQQHIIPYRGWEKLKDLRQCWHQCCRIINLFIFLSSSLPPLSVDFKLTFFMPSRSAHVRIESLCGDVNRHFFISFSPLWWNWVSREDEDEANFLHKFSTLSISRAQSESFNGKTLCSDAISQLFLLASLLEHKELTCELFVAASEWEMNVHLENNESSPPAERITEIIPALELIFESPEAATWNVDCWLGTRE